MKHLKNALRLSYTVVNSKFAPLISLRRFASRETEFYNRYYYPPPTVLSHPPAQEGTRILEPTSITTALTDMSQLPSIELFAVVFICGKQHKITVHDLLLVTQMAEVEVFSCIQLEKVLLVGSVNWSLIGTPLIPRGVVKVRASVLEHKSMEPVIVFKKKIHNYKKTNIHRGLMTLLRIEDILVEGSFQVDTQQIAVHPEDGLKSIYS